VSARACGWCGAALAGKKRVACNDAHRALLWRWQQRPEWTPFDPPPYRQNGSERRSRTSGRQVSYRKAVRAAIDTAVALGIPFDHAAPVAEVMVLEALPERQRLARTPGPPDRERRMSEVPALGKLAWPYPVEHCALTTCERPFKSEADAAYVYHDQDTGKMVVFCEDCSAHVELNHALRFKLVAL
jgi:hypothetical protein